VASLRGRAQPAPALGRFVFPAPGRLRGCALTADGFARLVEHERRGIIGRQRAREEVALSQGTVQELRVRAGARVAWTNRGQTTHTVKGPGFFSQALDPGKTYRHRFTRPGRYPYVCTLHPTLMKGTIVVG
jgi:hypothetical protein